MFRGDWPLTLIQSGPNFGHTEDAGGLAAAAACPSVAWVLSDTMVATRWLDSAISDIVAPVPFTRRDLASTFSRLAGMSVLVSRTGNLHRHIECQEVGLEGNAIGHSDDVGNLARHA